MHDTTPQEKTGSDVGTACHSTEVHTILMTGRVCEYYYWDWWILNDTEIALRISGIAVVSSIAIPETVIVIVAPISVIAQHCLRVAQSVYCSYISYIFLYFCKAPITSYIFAHFLYFPVFFLCNLSLPNDRQFHNVQVQSFVCPVRRLGSILFVRPHQDVNSSDSIFTLHYHETTTSQIKKQMDCHLRYFSYISAVAHIYFWSLCAGQTGSVKGEDRDCGWNLAFLPRIHTYHGLWCLHWMFVWQTISTRVEKWGLDGV